ncbi:MAG: hypothetical protein R2752_12000 [Vicinamibacterales bacterium]
MTAERESRIPVHGDVVISRRSASTVYELAVVPGPPQLAEETYASAGAQVSPDDAPPGSEETK